MVFFSISCRCERGGLFSRCRDPRRRRRATSRGAHAGLRCCSISSGRELTGGAAAMSGARCEGGECVPLARLTRRASSLLSCRAEYRRLAHVGVRAMHPPDSPRPPAFLSVASHLRAGGLSSTEGRSAASLLVAVGQVLPWHSPRGGKFLHNGKYLASGLKSRCSR